MHTQSIEPWRHDHLFLGADHARSERRTWWVIGLTACMMVAEIVGGVVFGSMALLADGFHMATHAGALLVAAVAYLCARRFAHDRRFTFGTGKLTELAGFSSALLLAVIALSIGVESTVRLASPQAIRFEEAMAVAALGLVVNLVSAWLLHEGGHGHHGREGGADHAHGRAAHGHHDHNLRAAYLHVLTDALTSVLAIAGLACGWFFGWLWMDPLMGIVGSIVIARWSWGLMRGAGALLLDTIPDASLSGAIRQAIEQDGDRVSDLHLWRVGPGHMAAIVSVVSDHPRPPEHYKAKLAALAPLSHVTVEVHPCDHGLQAA